MLFNDLSLYKPLHISFISIYINKIKFSYMLQTFPLEIQTKCLRFLQRTQNLLFFLFYYIYMLYRSMNNCYILYAY